MAQSSQEIYWSAILADFRRSSLTHVQFCQLRRISVHSFRAWLYRLRPGLPPPRSNRRPDPRARVSTTPAFLPVHLRPRPPVASADHSASRPLAPLELILRRQRRLRVPVGFDPATLRQLLDVLEERS